MSFTDLYLSEIISFNRRKNIKHEGCFYIYTRKPVRFISTDSMLNLNFFKGFLLLVNFILYLPFQMPTI